MSELTIEIGGMQCGHCVGSVKRALDAVSGVEVRQVTVGAATVRFDERVITPAQIAQAIVDEGYPVVAAG